MCTTLSLEMDFSDRMVCNQAWGMSLLFSKQEISTHQYREYENTLLKLASTTLNFSTSFLSSPLAVWLKQKVE